MYKYELKYVFVYGRLLWKIICDIFSFYFWVYVVWEKKSFKPIKPIKSTTKNRTAICRKTNPKWYASILIMRKPTSIGSVINLAKHRADRTAHTSTSSLTFLLAMLVSQLVPQFVLQLVQLCQNYPFSPSSQATTGIFLSIDTYLFIYTSKIWKENSKNNKVVLYLVNPFLFMKG